MSWILCLQVGSTSLIELLQGLKDMTYYVLNTAWPRAVLYIHLPHL